VKALVEKPSVVGWGSVLELELWSAKVLVKSLVMEMAMVMARDRVLVLVWAWAVQLQPAEPQQMSHPVQ
jgi:hypothetical protein